jgi:hypothetical protein
VHANLILGFTFKGTEQHQEKNEPNKKVRSEFSLHKFYVLCCVVKDVKCLKVSLNIFCLMSKYALEINIIALCFTV